MLEITVFLCGALVMVLEMTGARVLAPHVGTSVIVWTSLIGIVLTFLAFGAWAGGYFADKRLSRKGLALVLGCAGAGCMITAFCHNAIGSGISGSISNLYIGAILAAICIYAIPAFFFGIITPYAIRLKLANLATAGQTVGRLYALSTAGSILGTFLGGFLLISIFSSSLILWGVSICMILLSILNFRAKPLLRIFLLATGCFFCWQDQDFANWQAQKNRQILIESPYNSIRLMEGTDYSKNNARIRLMATDPGYSQSGMEIDNPDGLYFKYTRYYGLGPAIHPEAKTILMLGGGGYSVPKWLLSGKSGLKSGKPELLRVVEIDPAMTDTAKKYFALKSDPVMDIIHEDARAFLNRQNEKYDLVFVDVFNSHYSIPFQMGTKEAAEALQKAVAPDGMALINLISAIEGEDGKLFRSIWQNLKSVFPNVEVYCVGNPSDPSDVQNLMVVAQNSAAPRKIANGTYRPEQNPDMGELLKMENNLYRGQIENDVPPLTDDFAPVEKYTLMLAKHK